MKKVSLPQAFYCLASPQARKCLLGLTLCGLVDWLSLLLFLSEYRNSANTFNRWLQTRKRHKNLVPQPVLTSWQLITRNDFTFANTIHAQRICSFLIKRFASVILFVT